MPLGGGISPPRWWTVSTKLPKRQTLLPVCVTWAITRHNRPRHLISRGVDMKVYQCLNCNCCYISLFVIVMESISREIRVALPWELLYADDLALIAETEEELIKDLMKGKITWRIKAWESVWIKPRLWYVEMAFSALTLGSRKGIRPVKNWVVRCWRGYLSGARCRLAYGPADATATHCLLLQ